MEQIFDFASKDDLENVKKLIDEGCDVNKLNSNNENVAHFAARNNSQKVMDYVIEKGVDINAQTTGKKETPLFYAIRGNSKEIFEKLLNADADIELENEDGETPIFAAIRVNNQEFVEQLLKKNAKLDKKNKKGETPYMLAIQNEDSPIASMILQNEALTSIEKQSVMTICNEAETAGNIHKRNYEETFAVLFDYCVEDNANALLENIDDIDVNTQCFDGETLLHCAVESNSINCVKALLEHGADPNLQTTTFMEPPLHIAIQNGNADICDALIEGHADIEVANAEGESAIFIAIRCEDIGGVRALINNHANLNILNISGLTPLQVAITLHQNEIAKLLIHEGASTSLGSLNSYAVALENNEMDICDAIREYDPALARQAIKSQSGRRPNPPPDFFACLKKGDPKKLRRLMTSQYDMNVAPSEGIPLFKAIESKSLDIVKIVINAGADIDILQNNTTPLAFACKNGTLEIVQYLLSQGASPHVVNEEGETAIFSAVRSNDINILQEIINQHDVQINITNHNGMSPLYIAVGMKSKQAIRALLAAGADPNTTGHSPLKLAQEMKDQRLINLLIESGANTHEKRQPRMTRQQELLKIRGGLGSSMMRTRKSKIFNLSRPITPKPIMHGTCCQCGAKRELMKLLPCGHACVCRKCLPEFAEKYNECPVCQMGFFASSKFN